MTTPIANRPAPPAPRTGAVSQPPVPPAAREAARTEGGSQATELMELAAAARFWHDEDATAYATIEVHSWREHWRLRGRPFAQWLARRYFENHDRAPRAAAVADALNQLEARARFDGERHRSFLRVASHEGRIFLDLADRHWRAAAIGAGHWEVVERPEVRFRRAKAMLALPKPIGGGSLTLLRQFINVHDDDWPMVAAWLVAALRPTGPYPVLFLHGEQGSGKSTQARMLRSLIDPNSASLRAAPRNTHDLAVAANNAWVISLDNLSRLPWWLSDALCRLSSGSGFSTRALYEDDEEAVFSSQRPVLVNGIDDLATRGDLLDRAVVVHLPAIAAGKRRTEAQLWGDFEKQRPAVLGALLDAVATAQARLSSVALAELPRMADFAQWAAAAGQSLGCAPDAFEMRFARHHIELERMSLESCPIGDPLLRIAERNTWRGTAGMLLLELDSISLARQRAHRDWPRGFSHLGSLLRRLAPSLRTFGLHVEFLREGHQGERIIEVRLSPEAQAILQRRDAATAQTSNALKLQTPAPRM